MVQRSLLLFIIIVIMDIRISSDSAGFLMSRWCLVADGAGLLMGRENNQNFQWSDPLTLPVQHPFIKPPGKQGNLFSLVILLKACLELFSFQRSVSSGSLWSFPELPVLNGFLLCLRVSYHLPVIHLCLLCSSYAPFKFTRSSDLRCVCV